MQFTTVAAFLAAAGFAMASPAPAEVTITTSTTQVVTITSCAPTVTECPARTQTVTYPVSVVYPAGHYPTAPGALYPSACASGTNCPYASGALTYNVPSPTGAYHGPSFTGAAAQMKAGAALAGVGAVAALLL